MTEIVAGYVQAIQKFCNFPIIVSIKPDANFLGSNGMIKNIAESHVERDVLDRRRSKPTLEGTRKGFDLG